jgi:hypothetical protein
MQHGKGKAIKKDAAEAAPSGKRWVLSAHVPINLLQASAMPGLAMMAVTIAKPIIENV